MEAAAPDTPRRPLIVAALCR